MFKKILAFATFLLGLLIYGVSSASADLLTITGGTVQVTESGVSAVSTSATALLTTVFEILKFLPIIALIIGGFFILNKIFSIIKSAGSGGGK